MFARLLTEQMEANKSYPASFSDVTSAHWAYWYVMEAANGHDYTKSGNTETWLRTYP